MPGDKDCLDEIDQISESCLKNQHFPHIVWDLSHFAVSSQTKAAMKPQMLGDCVRDTQFAC